MVAEHNKVRDMIAEAKRIMGTLLDPEDAPSRNFL